MYHPGERDTQIHFPDSMKESRIIAIDAFRLWAKPTTSGTIYVRELVSCLHGHTVILLLPRKPDEHFPASDVLQWPGIREVHPSQPLSPERSFFAQVHWIQVAIPSLLRSLPENPDFLIAPYHHPSIFVPRGISIVTVIHDLCGLMIKQVRQLAQKQFYRHFLMLLIATLRSDRIIAVSEYTRREILRVFRYVHHERVVLVPNGTSTRTLKDDDVPLVLKQYRLSRYGYFLGFGAVGWRKGLDVTLDAFLAYRSGGGHALLILITTRETVPAVRTMLEARGLQGVVLLSELASSVRDALYAGALALLFPSRCEGFGYPLIEAMRQGCPPVALIRGPAAEILGGIVPLLPVGKPQAVCTLMHHYESMALDTRSGLSQALINRSLDFSPGVYARNLRRALGLDGD